MKLTKDEARKKLLDLRRSMDPAYHDEVSLKISRLLGAMLDKRRMSAVFLYASFDNEVDTWRMIRAFLKSNIKVALPRVSGDELEFYYYNEGDELIKNSFGIYEPNKDMERAERSNDSVLVVPMVGFDDSGNRLGYGGGYYDRYIKKYRNEHDIVVGIAFDIQSELPFEVDAFDERMDYIVTQSRVIMKDA